MKRLSILVPLMLAACVLAAPASDTYPVKVHVYSSHLLFADHASSLVLNVIIGDGKYELSAPADGVTLLALGDYKAKLIKDEHRTVYESAQVYELLFPDQRTRKFSVVGQAQ